MKLPTSIRTAVDLRGWAAALAVAVIFFAVSLPFLSAQYDLSALTYAVVAEEGLSKSQQAVHPLYLPLLRASAAALRFFSAAPPFIKWFQLLSLLAAAAFLAALCGLSEAFSEEPWSAALATGCFAVQGHVWKFSMQTKPYMLAAALSTAALLVAVRRAASGRLRDGLAAGALAGLAVGFDPFSLAVVPALWLARAWDPERGAGAHRRFCAAAAASTILFCALYLLALKGGLQAQLAAVYAPQAFAGASWYRSPNPLSLLSSYASWLLRRGPELLLFLAASCALAALTRSSADWARVRRAAIFAACVFGSFSVFFLVGHSTDDFFFAAALGLPPLLAALTGRSQAGRAMLACVLLATAVHSFARTIRPLHDARSDFALAEGAFLAERLGTRALLLSPGAPDWRIAYVYGHTLRILRLDVPPSSHALFAPAGLAVLPDVLDLAEADLMTGDPVYITGEPLFLPTDVLDAAQLEAQTRQVQAAVTKRFRLGPPLISPQAQYYYPLLKKAD